MHAEQIRASIRDYVVMLDGLVRNEQEKRQAELDAWAVFSVDGGDQPDRSAVNIGDAALPRRAP